VSIVVDPLSLGGGTTTRGCRRSWVVDDPWSLQPNHIEHRDRSVAGHVAYDNQQSRGMECNPKEELDLWGTVAFQICFAPSRGVLPPLNCFELDRTSHFPGTRLPY
jgi:hypothetical protein